MNRRLLVVSAALLGLLPLGCDADMDEDDDPTPSTPTATATSQQTANGEGSTEWENVTDPVEKAFTIELPKGWKNEAYLKRIGIITHTIATTASPDGSAALFYGDPKMPTFIEPQSLLPHQRNDPSVRGQAYTPAERFLPTYLKSRFGKMPGFQIIGVSPEPELVEKNRAIAQKQGFSLSDLNAARVDFTFKDGENVRRGAIYGTTLSIGMVWVASVAGIVSNDDPQKLRTMLFHIMESPKTDSEWKEKEKQAAADRQRQHEYVMAQIARNTEQLQINHRNNMATLNGMAVRHQARMDAIHAAGDASMAAYKARDIASDNNHRGFLNYITDQHTVAGPSGRTFQVENQYERYYINKSDNSYIGLKGGTSLNDLNGVNPDDYEEAKILR